MPSPPLKSTSPAPEREEQLASGETEREASPIQRALSARLMRVASRLARHLSDEDAERAVSASSDMDALAVVLARAPVVSEPADPVVAAAYARGRAAREALLAAEGGAASAEEMGNLLGISRPAVDKARKASRLLALRERGDWVYPRWQVWNGALLEGLAQVLAELEAGEHDTWAKMIFFLETDTEREGESPLEALRAGRLEVALRAARGYGEHGAR
jgi:hypothetical protein